MRKSRNRDREGGGITGAIGKDKNTHNPKEATEIPMVEVNSKRRSTINLTSRSTIGEMGATEATEAVIEEEGETTTTVETTPATEKKVNKITQDKRSRAISNVSMAIGTTSKITTAMRTMDITIIMDAIRDITMNPTILASLLPLSSILLNLRQFNFKQATPRSRRPIGYPPKAENVGLRQVCIF